MQLLPEFMLPTKPILILIPVRNTESSGLGFQICVYCLVFKGLSILPKDTNTLAPTRLKLTVSWVLTLITTFDTAYIYIEYLHIQSQHSSCFLDVQDPLQTGPQCQVIVRSHKLKSHASSKTGQICIESHFSIFNSYTDNHDCCSHWSQQKQTKLLITQPSP